MKNDEFLLSFELGERKDVLNIHADLNGLENLIDELNKLLESTKRSASDHINLMTEEWGGYEFSSESQGGEIINQVNIHCWNEK